jgi:hypothetical protein
MKIHRACGGIPRLINQLTDHAMVLAVINNYLRVDSTCVDEAWADLQQLPGPYGSQPHAPRRDMPVDIVEFGDLPADEATSHLEATAHISEQHLSPSELTYRPTEFHPTDVVVDPDDIENEMETTSSTEVTLVFHSSTNPFGDDFEEEELVIDHFVSPDALAQRHRRQVHTHFSRRLAEQLYQLRHGQSSRHDATCEIISLSEHAAGVAGNMPPEKAALPDSSESLVSPSANPSPSGTDTTRNYRHLFSQIRLQQG